MYMWICCTQERMQFQDCSTLGPDVQQPLESSMQNQAMHLVTSQTTQRVLINVKMNAAK